MPTPNLHCRSVIYVILCVYWPLIASSKDISYLEIDQLIETAIDTGDTEQAIIHLNVGRAKSKNEFGTQDTLYANYTAQLGYIYSLNEQYSQAIKLLLEAKDIQASVIGINDISYASTLNDLGLVYIEVGDYKQAERYTKVALKIIKQNIGTQNQRYAITLNNLAHLYELMGRFSQAEQFFKKVKKIDLLTLGHEHPDYAVTLDNMGKLYRSIGRYGESEYYLLEAIRINKKALGQSHPNYANNLNNLALLYFDMGKYDQAETLYIEASTIYAKSLGVDHSYYATSIHNLATLYAASNQLKKAHKYFSKALNLFAKTRGQQSIVYLNCLDHIADLYIRMGRYHEAELLFEEVLLVKSNSIGPTHPLYGTSLDKLAQLYQKQKKFKQAEKLFLKAIEITKNAWGTHHPKHIISIINMANHYRKAKNYLLAQQYAFIALRALSLPDLEDTIDANWVKTILQHTFTSNEHRFEMTNSLNLVFQLLSNDKSNKSRKQKAWVTQVAIMLFKQIKDSFCNEKDKLRMLAKSHEWMIRSLAVLDHDTQMDKIFDIVELHKSVLLLEAIQKSNVNNMSFVPDSIIYLEKELHKQFTQVQATLYREASRSIKDSLRALLNTITLKIDSFKNEIEKKHPKFAKLKYQPSGISIRDIQKSLHDQTALIEYIVSDSMLYIIYIDQNNAKIHNQPIYKSDLFAKLDQLRAIVSDYSQTGHRLNVRTAQNEFVNTQYVEAAHWCYTHLIAPVIKGNRQKNLIIIPDEKLAQIPFETFLVEKPNTKRPDYNQLYYLVKDINISYNYSALLWKENNDYRVNQPSQTILAMASSYQQRYHKDYPKLRWPKGSLQSLPAAKKEVLGLKKKYKGYFAVDTIATERNFKFQAKNHGIIHLAMHGIINDRYPMLSGLVFSEDGDSIEDNLLYAYEVTHLELMADLIVLSACETGHGRFDIGNGVASLARAFMYAGAPSLVVSMWQVDDFITATIMKSFYQNLAMGQGKAEAIRQAKLSYIKKAKGSKGHPAFWAPFIHIGNSTPIKIQQKTNKKWVIWSLIVGLCIPTILLLYRKQKIVRF